MRYPKSVNFIELLMDLYIYDEILDMIQMRDKKLLHFKFSKSGHILRVDKTCFPRPSHKCFLIRDWLYTKALGSWPCARLVQ